MVLFNDLMLNVISIRMYPSLLFSKLNDRIYQLTVLICDNLPLDSIKSISPERGHPPKTYFSGKNHIPVTNKWHGLGYIDIC